MSESSKLLVPSIVAKRTATCKHQAQDHAAEKKQLTRSPTHFSLQPGGEFHCRNRSTVYRIKATVSFTSLSGVSPLSCCRALERSMSPAHLLPNAFSAQRAAAGLE